MKVNVDYDLCASTGACAHVCPQVFEIGNDGMLHVLQDDPGPELAPAVAEAAELCPTGAIAVEGLPD